MTTLEVRCKAHGEVVRVKSTEVWTDHDARMYRFTCPVCGAGTGSVYDAGILDLLRAAGVEDIEQIVEREAMRLRAAP